MKKSARKSKKSMVKIVSRMDVQLSEGDYSSRNSTILLYRSHNISMKLKSLMTNPEKLELTFNQKVVCVAGKHKN
jgi:hypothetical protein